MAKKPEKVEVKAPPKAVKPAPDPRAVVAAPKPPKVETFNNGRQDRVVYTHQRNKAQ